MSAQRVWLGVGCLLLVACSLRVDSERDRHDEQPDAAASHQSDAGMETVTETEAEPRCDVQRRYGALPLVCPTLHRCAAGADPVEHFRLVSWNIKVGAVQGLAAIIEVLRRLDADVVVLQEVDSKTDRTGRVDQAQEVAKALGMQSVFAPTLALEGGEYGIAILSRLDFASVERIPLTNVDAAEPRTALDVVLCVGSEELRVINHHADYLVRGANRSVVEVLAALADRHRGRTIFAGDLNLQPAELGPLACLDAGFVDAVASFDTSATHGSSRIDYIFVDEEMDGWVLRAEVHPTQASDHRALVVELAL